MSESIDTDEEFFHAWMQEIYSESQVREDFHESMFTERVCEFLVNDAVIENYTTCAYRKSTAGLKIDAYNYDAEAGALDMLVTDFHPGYERLSNTSISSAAKRAVRFFERSLLSDFHRGMEESHPAYALARLICDCKDTITKVRFLLISNGFLSARATGVDIDGPDGFQAVYEVWDLGRMRRIEQSARAREDVIVDFTADGGKGLPCLPASAGIGYQSYLIVMPGILLAGLYDTYGERLLEQNVRTFLQFRSKVNKGIRNTITNEPSMFFAYNNGITATADEVVAEAEGGMHIRSVRNLQIVNGGQTTASLYAEMKKSKNPLEEVFVQVKLSVIPDEDSERVVPRISEFANTQNKVSAADFFSNHPFHLRVETISRRLWAPAPHGTNQDTHWYYERVRGQFLNAQANLTEAQKRKFLIENPRPQMFTKTDLAKFEAAWKGAPQLVSLGAQKNFVKFAEEVARNWESNEAAYNDTWFRDLISKAVIYRSLDKLIMKQSWYGGYKANIVAYTVAVLATRVRDRGEEFNFERLWKLQEVPDDLMAALLGLAETVNDCIQDTPTGITNVTEYCKREQCRFAVLSAIPEIPDSIAGWFVGRNIIRERAKDAREERRIDNGIEAQTWVFEKGPDYWKSVLEWNIREKVLAERDIGILTTASRIPAKIPTERQCLALVGIIERATEEGFYELI